MSTQRDDLIARYTEWLAHNRGRAPATIDKYTGHLRRLEQWLHGRGTRLECATRQEVEQFAGIEAHRAGLRPRARVPLVAAVRGMYRWASSRGLIETDPARNLPYPRTGSPLPTPLSLYSAERLLMAPDIDTFIGLRDISIMALLMGTGLRISGLVALNESSLLWSRDQDGIDRLTIKVTEKGGRDRFVPVPHEARLLVTAYLGHEELHAIDRVIPGGDRVLFVNTRNPHVPAHEHHGEARRLTRKEIARRILKYGMAAGLPRDQLHPHAFRHLYGTELVESGTDTLTTQALMGHRDPKSTAVYTHLAMRTLQARVDEANPLGKMRTPVTDLARRIARAKA